MMMERIATAPVDQANVGQRDRLAVERERLAWVEQQIGNARRRDIGPGSILQTRQIGRLDPPARTADGTGPRAITKSKSAPRQTNLAQHGRQRRARPVGLLAVIGALQRP